MDPVKGNNPRKTIELIQAVERVLRDLQVLGEEDAVKTRVVAQSIESKLPDSMKEKWLAHKSDPASGLASRNHFDCLLQYLRRQEDILEELDQLQLRSSEYPEKSKEKNKERKAFTRVMSGNAPKSLNPSPCIACGDEEHGGRLFTCKVFKRMNLLSKKAQLRKSGSCFKCLRVHGDDGSCTQECLCSKEDCRTRGSSDHNYLLCPIPQTSKEKKSDDRKSGEQKKGLGLTEKQEELIAKLPSALLNFLLI